MKKSKLFQSALSLMLVGGMLTACGSSASSTAASTAASTGSDSAAASTASDSAAPAATKQYVIGIAEAQANDEVTTRRAYLEDFIAPHLQRQVYLLRDPEGRRSHQDLY